MENVKWSQLLQSAVTEPQLQGGGCMTTNVSSKNNLLACPCRACAATGRRPLPCARRFRDRRTWRAKHQAEQPGCKCLDCQSTVQNVNGVEFLVRPDGTVGMLMRLPSPYPPCDACDVGVPEVPCTCADHDGGIQ